MTVAVMRVHDDAGHHDDHRVLVDRLWPRGVRRDAVDCDEWPKDVARSDGLRKWYGHDPVRFAEFATRYRAELADGLGRDAVERLADPPAWQEVTLLGATRDVEHAGAAVRRGLIGARGRRRRSR